MAKTKTIGGSNLGSSVFKPKTKKQGKPRKKWGPKDKRPQAYKGQGR